MIPTKPGFDPVIKITVAIAPGPVINGIASGKTEGSSISSFSVWLPGNVTVVACYCDCVTAGASGWLGPWRY